MKSLNQGFLVLRRSPAFAARPFAFPRHRSVLSAVLVACAALACGGDDEPVAPPGPPVATAVEVAPATTQLSALGRTVQLAATVRDQDGNAMAGASVTWASSANAVATVTATGLVTAAGNGSATITATSGSASGTASVTVAQTAAVATLTPDSVHLAEIGGTAQLVAEVTDANGNVIADAAVSWSSADEAVATVDEAGVVTAVGNGATTVTAASDGASASAAITVDALPMPGEGPPAPTHAADSVVSLFSDSYEDAAVDTWSADWDDADVDDVSIAGNAAKRYSGLVFAGIEFTSAPIDVTDMTHFRMDIWTPDPTEAAAFRVKLVDFGANGVWDGGGDDSEHELTITANEGLATEQWVRLDLALADFGGLTGRGNLAQLIISGDPNTVYVDNVYFRIGEPPPPPGEPTEAAPAPTEPADKVVSLFSDAYTDVTVDTWSADWDNAAVEDVEIAGNAVKKYSGLVFAGIEFTSATVDASDMTHFRMDIWTPDPTEAAAFRVKLVDFGANGVWDGGGDDSEHEVTITANEGLATGQWVRLDLALADFGGLAAREHLAQLIISGDPNTVFVDNVYFRMGEAPPPPEAPTEPAPTPPHHADSVISLFSDAYTDVTVDTWSADWDNAAVEDVEIAGNAVKKYSGLVFAGIEFTSATVDASDMTHFRMDIWTPDPTEAAAFRVKLVDFGANGVWDGGGDDSEHEMTITAAEGLATGQWVQLDLALADFTGLAATEHLAQLIISGDPNTVYVDNVYLRR